jgi:multidrug efflux pump subunit AcrA (membrane-fusion protein)
MPLRDHEGRTMGALVVLGNEPVATSSHTVAFVRAAERSLATALGVMQRLEGGSLVRIGRAAGRLWQTKKGKAALVVILALLAALAVPLPYKVKCDCQLEPVTRRFVAAPFEGTLQRASVKPGDVVREGDVLKLIHETSSSWPVS